MECGLQSEFCNKFLQELRWTGISNEFSMMSVMLDSGFFIHFLFIDVGTFLNNKIKIWTKIFLVYRSECYKSTLISDLETTFRLLKQKIDLIFQSVFNSNVLLIKK